MAHRFQENAYVYLFIINDVAKNTGEQPDGRDA
jgi:hypothetical protein